MRTLILACAFILASATPSLAVEICGNGVDDDGDDLADEGCLSSVCESPLSCGDTGLVSPVLGQLNYSLPPDVAPNVPYGPGIGFRRSYVSQLDPGAGPPVWKKPLGDRWTHTYMTWLTKTGSGSSAKIVVRLSQGRDVLAKYSSTSSGWDYYKPQLGIYYQHVRQRTTSPNEIELKLFSGETLVYNSSGRLTEIRDTLASPNTNKVLVAYDASSQVSTVTDASGKRRLLFSYTSNLLTSVQFQIFISSAWTTQHTTSYSYTSGALQNVTIGGSLAQANGYTSGYLTQISDAASNTIAAFRYDGSSPKKIVGVDNPRGYLGYEYNSSRTSCSGKTVLYFNKGNATNCSVDTDCGTGFLCGGKTGAGSTGKCFRAARCLTTSSPSEDVITTVAPIGPPSETCDGACTDVAEYVWETLNGAGAPVLNLKALKDPANKFISRVLDANGLPTAISCAARQQCVVS